MPHTHKPYANGSNGVEANGHNVDEASSSPRPNLSLWLNKQHELSLSEEDIPDCGPDDCLIHVKATGICGSDLHLWKEGRVSDLVIDQPIIPGHEASGQILKVGFNVIHLQEGDRVAIEPGVPCQQCGVCVAGRYNLCEDVFFCGVPSDNGTIRRYHAHPARYLYKMPDTMSYGEGALIEPLSVAYHAIRRAQPDLGTPTLIAGAGPIGLSTALCARAAGCHPIIITDLAESRLAQARDLGFRTTLKVEMSWDSQTTADKIVGLMEKSYGCRPSLALECTGAQQSILTAGHALARGGKFLQVGCGKPQVTIDIMSLQFREIDIILVQRYHSTWPTVMRLVNDGILGDVTKLITHTLPLEKAIEAFETLVDSRENAIKVQIID